MELLAGGGPYGPSELPSYEGGLFPAPYGPGPAETMSELTSIGENLFLLKEFASLNSPALLLVAAWFVYRRLFPKGKVATGARK